MNATHLQIVFTEPKQSSLRRGKFVCGATMGKFSGFGYGSSADEARDAARQSVIRVADDYRATR